MGQVSGEIISKRRAGTVSAVRLSARRHPMITGIGVVMLCCIGSYWWAHFAAGARYSLFDLRIYDAAVRHWAAGNDLYGYSQFDSVNGALGFTYPPLAAVLMSPMAVLPWPVVATLTVAAIVACGVCCVWLCLRERLTLPTRAQWVATGVGTAVVFALVPISQTLEFGQINLFLAALVLGDLLVLGRRDSRLAGIGVGLAMAVKLTPGVFLLYFLLTRAWRAMAVAVGTAVVATLAAALLAPGETWDFFTSLVFSDRTGYAGATANQSVNGLLARFAYPGPPSSLLWLSVVAVVAVVAVLRIRTALARRDRLGAITLTGLAGVLISPVSWTHHFVWVIPAVIIVGARLLRVVQGMVADPRTGSVAAVIRRLRPAAGSIALAATGLVILGFDTRVMFKLPGVDYTNRSVLAMLAGSLLMFWSLAALCALPLGGPGRPGRDADRGGPVCPDGARVPGLPEWNAASRGSDADRMSPQGGVPDGSHATTEVHGPHHGARGGRRGGGHSATAAERAQ